MENTRFLYNIAILDKLSELVKKYPHLRFTQLLWNAGIIRKEKYGYPARIADTFYEESEKTWELMRKNEFCFPPNKSENN